MQHGRTIDEIEIGDRACISKTFTEADVTLFACLTGDVTSFHIDEEAAKKSIFGARTVHGMLTASLVSTVCSTYLPGPGAFGFDVYVKLVAPVFIGDTVTAWVEVVEKNLAKNRIKVKLRFVNQHGREVLIGDSWCIPPRKEGDKIGHIKKAPAAP